MKVKIIYLVLLAQGIFGCATNPKGASIVKSENGNASSISYVTAKEMENNLRNKVKDETDLQIELKMIPHGGRLVYDAHHYKISLSEQDNTLPFISVVQNGKEIKFCDDADFKSQDESAGASVNGVGLLVPIKDNRVEIHCDIGQALTGEFEVHILDQNKKVIEKYSVNTVPEHGTPDK